MSSSASSSRSDMNALRRTRSGATYGASGAAAPPTPVRGPSLTLVDPADKTLRRASLDTPSFLEQEEVAPRGALQCSAGFLPDLCQIFEALEHGFRRGSVPDCGAA